MKKVISFIACTLLLLLAPVSIKAQNDEAKYLEGAVTLKNGYVEFEKSYNVPGKSKEDIFSALQNYIQTSLIDGPESLKQSRMVVLIPLFNLHFFNCIKGTSHNNYVV